MHQGWFVEEVTRSRGDTDPAKPGLYSLLMQLPQETGGDTCQFQFNIRDDGTVDQP
jgi:hypothetical protein